MLDVGKQLLHFGMHLGEVVTPCVRLDVFGDQILGDVTRQTLERSLLCKRFDDNLVAEQVVGFFVEFAERMVVKEGHVQAPKTSSRSGLCRRSAGGGGAAGGSKGSLYPASKCRAARSAR